VRWLRAPRAGYESLDGVPPLGKGIGLCVPQCLLLLGQYTNRLEATSLALSEISEDLKYLPRLKSLSTRPSGLSPMIQVEEVEEVEEVVVVHAINVLRATAAVLVAKVVLIVVVVPPLPIPRVPVALTLAGGPWSSDSRLNSVVLPRPDMRSAAPPPSMIGQYASAMTYIRSGSRTNICRAQGERFCAT
jgi:hypothetical protein